VRRLQNAQQLSRTNRADRGNLADPSFSDPGNEGLSENYGASRENSIVPPASRANPPELKDKY